MLKAYWLKHQIFYNVTQIINCDRAVIQSYSFHKAIQSHVKAHVEAQRYISCNCMIAAAGRLRLVKIIQCQIWTDACQRLWAGGMRMNVGNRHISAAYVLHMYDPQPCHWLFLLFFP